MKVMKLVAKSSAGSEVIVHLEAEDGAETFKLGEFFDPKVLGSLTTLYGYDPVAKAWFCLRLETLMSLAGQIVEVTA